MRFWPKSLAGRLAALLVLTLLAAQMLSFGLFVGERIGAFQRASREDLRARVVTLVALVEQTPPALHGPLMEAASSAAFRVAVRPSPALLTEETSSPELRAEIASAVGKPIESVRLAFFDPHRREGRGPGWRRRHGSPAWARLSVRLADGSWLNTEVDRPPVPPLGRAFLASLLISAVAVAAVGALGVRRASEPLRQLARAADRLGRGEAFDPLPEDGPQETRRANIAFNQMRERIDRFVRDRTAMLAAVGHDLRTPITSLRLRAEFIDDDETRARILETVAEMQAMAEAVLAFARDDGESEPSRLTDLCALTESIVEDAIEAGRKAQFEASDRITVTCRPFGLRRAINNVVDNAALYGGAARVRVEAGPGEARVIVEDDGPGIPESELERVFEPFVRLEGSRSRETGGAGLGLSIARTILRGHGGDLTLANRPGGGLTARLVLPA